MNRTHALQLHTIALVIGPVTLLQRIYFSLLRGVVLLRSAWSVGINVNTPKGSLTNSILEFGPLIVVRECFTASYVTWVK